jgi:hypothetical protein
MNILNNLTDRILLLLLALFCLLSVQIPAESWTTAPLSPAQSRCLKAYGHPSQFFIQFSCPGFPKRRIEKWLYPDQGISIMFDNGFFVKRSTISKNLAQACATNAKSKPEHFVSTLTRKNIINWLGQPDQTEEIYLGKHTISAIRYIKLGKEMTSVTFYDDNIVGVLSGFVLKAQSAK